VDRKLKAGPQSLVLSFDRYDTTTYSAEIIADVDNCRLFKGLASAMTMRPAALNPRLRIREGRKGRCYGLPCALAALANKARGHPGRASPSGRAGDHRRHAGTRLVLTGHAPDVP
jgi:hypothetical protein